MIRATSFGIGIFISFSAFAFSSNTTFWKKRQPFLKFTTAAQSVYVSNCSTVVTVQAQTAWGTAPGVSSPVTVNLSGTGFTYYSDSNCATPITSATIAAGTSSTSFYFVPSTTGPTLLTASAANYKDATQTETLSTNPFVWTGGGGNSNWNNGLNWSGGSAPGGGNQAIFDSTCVSNCSPSLTANASAIAVRIYSGYTGSISQNAFTMTVGSIGWYQEAGTFNGGSNTFSITGAYTIKGGSFTASSTGSTFTAKIAILGGTFTPGTAPFTITGSGTINTGSTVFPDVNLYPSNGNTYNVSGTMFVNGTLKLSNTTNNCLLNGGTIDVKGNVFVQNYGLPGTTTIKLTGTGTQNLDASTATGNRNFPSLEIASSGPVNFSGKLYVTGSYLYTSSGTFDAGTSSLMFVPSASGNSVSMGPVSYYDVGYNSNYSLSVLTDVIVSHKFILSGTASNAGYIEGPGKINLKGDLEISNDGGGKYVDIVISLSGNSDQTISYLTAGAKTPGFEINSTGGTVTFPATFTFNEGFKYIQGTVAGLTTANFVGHDGSTETIESGSYTFNDVFFTYGFNGAAYNITGSMNIGGNVSFGNGSYNAVNGMINLYGNLYYSAFYSYNVQLNLMGSGNQTLTGISENNTGVTFNVDKTGGTVKLLGALSCGNASFTITNGSFDMNGFAMYVRSIPGLNGNTLTKNGGVLNVNGSTIGTGSLYGGTVAP